MLILKHFFLKPQKLTPILHKLNFREIDCKNDDNVGKVAQIVFICAEIIAAYLDSSQYFEMPLPYNRPVRELPITIFAVNSCEHSCKGM